MPGRLLRFPGELVQPWVLIRINVIADPTETVVLQTGSFKESKHD
jgi:hypothetical protein